MTPGKDDNDVWHNSCRNRLKVSMGVQYEFQKRYRALYKKYFLLQPLQKTFTDLQCEPERGIPFQTIAETGMIAMGKRFHSEDYVQGRYQNLHFEQSDVLMEQRQYAKSSCSYSSSFIGRWMIVDFNKPLRTGIQIIQRGFFGTVPSSGFSRVEMESESFNRVFSS